MILKNLPTVPVVLHLNAKAKKVQKHSRLERFFLLYRKDIWWLSTLVKAMILMTNLSTFHRTTDIYAGNQLKKMMRKEFK